MRSDLAKVKGVSDIKTDIAARKCEFVFVPGEFDIESKLAELGKTNDHIAGFSIVQN